MKPDTVRRTSMIAMGTALLISIGVIILMRPDDPSTPPEDSSAPPDDGPPDAVGLVDWTTRSVADLDSDSWFVEFCDGDGAFLCIGRDDGAVGVIEHLSWPIEQMDVINEVLSSGGAVNSALGAYATDFLLTFEADRRASCGPEAEFRPDLTTSLAVGGLWGIRYGFEVEVDATTVEHVVGYASIAGDTLHILSTVGAADDGCAAQEGGFRVAELADALELLDRVAAASTWPS